MTIARHWPRILTLLLCSVHVTCGAEGTTIEILLDLPEGSDPFLGVASIRLEASGPEMSPLRQEIPYRQGAELTLPPIPLGPDRVIKVDGLNSAGEVVAQGQSAPFIVTDQEPRQLTILFQRCDKKYFLDADRDGFGVHDQLQVACTPPADYVENSQDCDDNSAEVHPNQTLFFDHAVGSAMSYDYNCDGKEEQEHTYLIDCAVAGPACKDQGWVDQVPACGQSGTFIACEKNASVCGPGPAQTLKQSCH